MPALNASSRETKNHDAPRTSTASSTSSAAPRCSRRVRMHLALATPHLDFAVADHVTHFTGAAVEHFSRLQSDARPAVTGRHARLAPGVECGALLRREEQTAEFLRAGGTGRRREPQAEQEEERCLHRLAARSMMVIRSISQSARSRGTMEAPVAAWPVRVIRHCFTE